MINSSLKLKETQRSKVLIINRKNNVKINIQNAYYQHVIKT